MVLRFTGLNWRMQLYSALVALVLLIAMHICQADTQLFLYVFIVGPILIVSSVFVAVYAVLARDRPRSKRLLQTLSIVWIVSTAFFVFELKHPIHGRSGSASASMATPIC